MSEWVRGISFFIFISIAFYFLWGNFFSGILSFVATDLTGASTTNSQIVTAMAWISFILLYLMTGPVYIMFSIISGSRGQVKTKPLYLLAAIAVWAVLMPILTVVYTLISTLVDSMSGLGVDALASQFSWLLGIIVLLGLVAFPFYFVLKGYGQLQGKGGVG